MPRAGPIIAMGLRWSTAPRGVVAIMVASRARFAALCDGTMSRKDDRPLTQQGGSPKMLRDDSLHPALGRSAVPLHTPDWVLESEYRPAHRRGPGGRRAHRSPPGRRSRLVPGGGGHRHSRPARIDELDDRRPGPRELSGERGRQHVLQPRPVGARAPGPLPARPSRAQRRRGERDPRRAWHHHEASPVRQRGRGHVQRGARGPPDPGGHDLARRGLGLYRRHGHRSVGEHRARHRLGRRRGPRDPGRRGRDLHRLDRALGRGRAAL